MTDNRTTELRKLLDERGVEYETNDFMNLCETHWNGFAAFQLSPSANLMMSVTPDQAIAATLGSDEQPYDELLRCLENDWHIRASWDGLRKFWCIELTDEGVRMRDAAHGTLTADQVRKTVAKHWQEPELSHDWQAVADELNARDERTCRIKSKIFIEGEYVPSPYYEYEMGCGGQFRWDDPEPPNCCPNCGAKVVDA